MINYLRNIFKIKKKNLRNTKEPKEVILKKQNYKRQQNSCNCQMFIQNISYKLLKVLYYFTMTILIRVFIISILIDNFLEITWLPVKEKNILQKEPNFFAINITRYAVSQVLGFWMWYFWKKVFFKRIKLSNEKKKVVFFTILLKCYSK